jgi:hypothetical protein
LLCFRSSQRPAADIFIDGQDMPDYRKGKQMRKYTLLLAAVAFIAAPKASFAYVATMNTTIVQNADIDQSGTATAGDLFDFADATFASYQPCPGDPVIGFNNGPNDLAQYRLSVAGVVNSTFPNPVIGPNVNYGGTYFLFYDQDQSGAFSAPDYRISAGTININALFDLNTGDADLNGTLNQVLGPELSPPFADLGPIVTVSGKYLRNVTNPTTGRIIDGTLTRPCGIPEPGSLAFLASGLLPLLGLRRRR